MNNKLYFRLHYLPYLLHEHSFRCHAQTCLTLMVLVSNDSNTLIQDNQYHNYSIRPLVYHYSTTNDNQSFINRSERTPPLAGHLFLPTTPTHHSMRGGRGTCICRRPIGSKNSIITSRNRRPGNKRKILVRNTSTANKSYAKKKHSALHFHFPPFSIVECHGIMGII